MGAGHGSLVLIMRGFPSPQLHACMHTQWYEIQQVSTHLCIVRGPGWCIV